MAHTADQPKCNESIAITEEDKDHQNFLERLKECKRMCKWNWDEKAEDYDRNFLHPTERYVQLLRGINFACDALCRTNNKRAEEMATIAANGAEQFKSSGTGELYRTHNILFEFVLKGDEDATNLYNEANACLNVVENRELIAVHEARDQLCNKLPHVRDWKKVVFDTYCDNVHGVLTSEQCISGSACNLDQVVELLGQGRLPLATGRTSLTPDEGEPAKKVLTEDEKKEVLNVAKAYAKAILYVGKNKALSMELIMVLHEQLFEGTTKKDLGGAYASGQSATALGHLLKLINDLMKSVDPITLASCAYMAIFCIHPFHQGNTRVAQIVAAWLLMENGFPPARTCIDKFNKWKFEKLDSRQNRDPRTFVWHNIESLRETIKMITETGGLQPEDAPSTSDNSSLGSQKAKTPGLTDSSCEPVEVHRMIRSPPLSLRSFSSVFFDDDAMELEDDELREVPSSVSPLIWRRQPQTEVDSTASLLDTALLVSSIDGGSDRDSADGQHTRITSAGASSATRSLALSNSSAKSAASNAGAAIGETPTGFAGLLLAAIAEYNGALLPDDEEWMWVPERDDENAQPRGIGALFAAALAEYNPDLLK